MPDEPKTKRTVSREARAAAAMVKIAALGDLIDAFYSLDEKEIAQVSAAQKALDRCDERDQRWISARTKELWNEWLRSQKDE